MKKRNILAAVILTLVLSFSLFAGCSKKEEVKNEENTPSETVQTISTEKMKDIIDDSNYVIVDIRESAAFNGWELDGISRGGHIKGAVDFPITWTKDIKDKELIKILENKNITKDKKVVIYDNKNESVNEMKKILNKLGYENIMTYENGINDWASNEKLPMEKLANYSKLVYPKWVNDLIKGNNPDTYTNSKFKIFEVSWGEPNDYLKGHIPGAYHLDTNAVEEEPIWNIVSDKDIENMLLNHGITYDTTVVLYGGDTTAAARAASVMLYAGVEDVRLLDGGYAAWEKAGYEVEKTMNELVKVESFGKEVPSNPKFIINTDEAKEILEADNAELVSIRSWEEYIGNTSGYTYIKPKGRIAGATWGHAGSDPYHMEDFRNIDNTMRNYEEIQAFWSEWGITPDKKVAFFCGTGWRASEAFFYSYLMGWENIAVYDGGWYEWSMNSVNPVELGEPKK